MNSDHSLFWLRCMGAASLSLFSMWAQATTWSIRPVCTGVSNCYTHPQDLTYWGAIAPGDTVLVYPPSSGGAWVSRYPGAAALSIDLARGNAGNPITVQGVNGAMVAQGLNISRSQYLNVLGLDISENRFNADGSGRAAVTIQAGSSDIGVSANKIHQATGHGVSVASTAGPRIVIGPGNGIYSNQSNGVTVLAPGSDAAAQPAVGSLVTGNTIAANGVHGVEVEASYWRVDHNHVLINGLNSGGSSGIHFFSASDKPGADCDFNEVLYNHVTGQRDSTQANGNGIQIDHFCDSNIVGFNVVWANDGAGISIMASRGNVVAMNTVYNNEQDTHRAGTPALRGEIILASWANFCWNSYIDAASCMLPVGRTSNNVIFDNVIHSSQAAVPGLLANPDAADPARNRNAIYPNLFFNSAGGANLRWGERDYVHAADIDRVTGLSSQGGGTLVEPPFFTDAANPGPGQNGLRLKAKPSLEGWVLPVDMVDMLGAKPAVGSAYFGAYYSKP